jgi:hypothetical protein
VVLAGQHAVDAARPIALGVEHEALALQVLADQLGQLHVVIDEQDSRHDPLDRRRRAHHIHSTPEYARSPGPDG